MSCSDGLPPACPGLGSLTMFSGNAMRRCWRSARSWGTYRPECGEPAVSSVGLCRKHLEQMIEWSRDDPDGCTSEG